MDDEDGERVAVGVVGDAETAELLADSGLRVATGGERELLDAGLDAIIAVGESALLSLARQKPTVPLLPVAAGAGVRSVPRDRVADAATRLQAGNWTTESHPLVSVEVSPDRTALALMDAMAVTAEPAHISEFTVASDGERIAQFRADGVVAATPAGSPGYARAAGGPIIPPGPDVFAIAPVAPFATTLDHWVAPARDLTITVEREEATVEVLADDRTVGIAEVGDPIRLGQAASVALVRVPEGQSPFTQHSAELEKL